MQKRPITSVRRDKDRLIDDVAIDCDLFRLERMSSADEPGTWWMRVSRSELGITFYLRSDGPIAVTVSEDDLSRSGRKRHGMKR